MKGLICFKKKKRVIYLFPTEFIKISKFITSWKGHTSEYIYNWTSNPFPGLFFVKNKKCIGNKFEQQQKWLKANFPNISQNVSNVYIFNALYQKWHFFSVIFSLKKMNRFDIPEWRCHHRGMWASPSVDHCGGCSCFWQCMSHSPQGLPA